MSSHGIHWPAPPRTALDDEWEAIRADLFRLGNRVDTAIDQAITALLTQDKRLAQDVMEADRLINARRYQLEDACLTAIARRQPVAGDLRRIIAAMHVAGELERIGDLAAGVANIVLMLQAPARLPLQNFDRMAQAARAMLRSCLHAFSYGDAEQADRAEVMDDKIDQFYQQNMRTLLTYMLEDAATIPEATYLLWVSHNLERIGDRCVNVSERTLRR
jgi:phosphate transport system protein